MAFLECRGGKTLRYSRYGMLPLRHTDYPAPDKCTSLLLRQCGPVRVPRMPGRTGGVRQRLKRLTDKQTPLPSIILANVCSLRHKLDEIQANMRVGFERKLFDLPQRNLSDSTIVD